MSEKLTLLSSIPPAEKAEAPKGTLKLLSSTPAEKKEEAPKVSLLSQTGISTQKEAPKETPGQLSLLSSQSAPSEPAAPKPVVTESTVVETVAATETSASQAVPEEPAGTSSFQVVTFASLFLGVLLVVGVAVFFAKKSGKRARKPSTVIGKAPAVAKSAPVEQPTTVAEPAPVAAAPVEEPAPVADVAPVEQPVASPPPVAAGNPDDPIIQFLNSETEATEVAAEPEKAVVQSVARPVPPPKPGRSGVTPPPKPGVAKKQEAPNAPTRVKAPAKPKKRF